MALANIGMQISKRMNLPYAGWVNRSSGWGRCIVVSQSSKADQCSAIPMRAVSRDL
jgi:hypothetical protein